MHRLLQTILAAAAISSSFAASNIDPDHTTVESAYLGEIDWRPSTEFGATINQYYASGFLKGPQVGWISLGSGSPLDGVRYRNDSADDYGVNVLPSGALRGFAYGANIGWINFSETGNPRVDWSTGRLAGSIYAANAGWISLESSDGLRVDRIAESPDQDGDSLPDAWEISRAGTLTRLSGETDSDNDGLSDEDEFLAGTNPLDQSEKLGPIALVLDSASNLKSVRWATKAGHIYRLESRASLQGSGPWAPVNSAPIIGTGSIVSLALPAGTASATFFRVRAYPPLTVLN